jgi:hypothetical protein
VRYALIFVGLSLLLEACVHYDTKLREHIIGTWSHSDSAEVTFVSDGSFQTKVKRVESEEKVDGKWKIRDGVLIMKDAHTYTRYLPAPTNIYSVVGRVDYRGKILLIDDKHLMVVSDVFYPRPGTKTNVWERER